jgi:ubiquinone/menaquinone biosynthesis C-methylase UbiE
MNASGILLNLGCGDAVQTHWLSKAYQIISLDLDSQRIKRASEVVNSDFVVASADCIPLRDRCVQAVVMISSFEHFSKPRITADECSRVVKLGGNLILTTDALTGANPVVKDKHRANYKVVMYCDFPAIHRLFGREWKVEYYTYFAVNRISRFLFDFGVATNLGLTFHLAFPAGIFFMFIPPLSRSEGYFLLANCRLIRNE